MQSSFKSSKVPTSHNDIVNTQFVFRQKLHESRNDGYKSAQGLGSLLIDLSLRYFKDLHPSLLLLKLMLEYDLSPTISTCKRLVTKISRHNDDSYDKFVQKKFQEEINYDGDDNLSGSMEGKAGNSLLHYDRIIALLVKVINAEEEDKTYATLESGGSGEVGNDNN